MKKDDRKKEYLDFLYYKIGKQSDDFQLQIQKKDGMFSKRKKYSEIGFEDDEWWLDKVNARTILKNEVVLDFDRPEGQSVDEFEGRVIDISIEIISNYNCKYAKFNSNSGIHLHLFFNSMLKMNPQERKAFRKKILIWFGGDRLKCTEKVTIALEFAKHWKSGKQKELIISNIKGVEKIGFKKNS
jgi:hypothetical protein